MNTDSTIDSLKKSLFNDVKAHEAIYIINKDNKEDFLNIIDYYKEKYNFDKEIITKDLNLLIEEKLLTGRLSYVFYIISNQKYYIKPSKTKVGIYYREKIGIKSKTINRRRFYDLNSTDEENYFKRKVAKKLIDLNNKKLSTKTIHKITELPLSEVENLQY